MYYNYKHFESIVLTRLWKTHSTYWIRLGDHWITTQHIVHVLQQSNTFLISIIYISTAHVGTFMLACVLIKGQERSDKTP